MFFFSLHFLYILKLTNVITSLEIPERIKSLTLFSLGSLWWWKLVCLEYTQKSFVVWLTSYMWGCSGVIFFWDREPHHMSSLLILSPFYPLVYKLAAHQYYSMWIYVSIEWWVIQAARQNGVKQACRQTRAERRSKTLECSLVGKTKTIWQTTHTRAGFK